MAVVLNEVGDVVLSDPATMLVLADAERFALLERLRKIGPATADELDR